MSRRYLPGGEPFTLGEGGHGVLALHGFTGSPFEVRALGELLHAAGLTVCAPALAGHATDESDLEGVTVDDYLESADRALRDALVRCERLSIVGLSLGGTIALHLASAHQEVARVVTISAPVFLYPMVNASVPLIDQWMPGLRAPANFAAWQGNVVGYKSASIASVRVLVDLLDRVRKQLSRVRVPLLVVHSNRDLTVPASSARAIHEEVSSEEKRLEIVDAGAHLMTVEPNLSLIGEAVVDFLTDRARSR